MNKLFMDYCKSRLTVSNNKPEYKVGSNVSFAIFIVDVAKCMNDIRECGLFPFNEINYV